MRNTTYYKFDKVVNGLSTCLIVVLLSLSILLVAVFTALFIYMAVYFMEEIGLFLPSLVILGTAIFAALSSYVIWTGYKDLCKRKKQTKEK